MSLLGKMRLWMAYNIHLGFHPQPERVLFAWLERQTRMRVTQGPFRGMKLVNAAFGSSLMPKMVGTYELEIQQDIEDLLGNNYHYFMDIGAAEGYYAVGMAMRLAGRKTKTYAYDIAPESAIAVSQAADWNGVLEKIEIRDLCRHSDFEIAKTGQTLVICDIEGAEKELLDPDAAPGLRLCDIVVEVHDGPSGHDIRNLLLKRFRNSHHIIQRFAAPRHSRDLGSLSWKLPQKLALSLMNEGRNFGIEWLVMKTKRVSID